jgi:hypothetical protein
MDPDADSSSGYSSSENTIMDSILESDDKLDIKLSRCNCRNEIIKNAAPPPYDVKGVQHGRPALRQSPQLIPSSKKCVPCPEGPERTRSHPMRGCIFRLRRSHRRFREYRETYYVDAITHAFGDM